MHPFGGTPICPRCSKAVYAAEQVSFVGLCSLITGQLVLTYTTPIPDNGPRKKSAFSRSLSFSRIMPTNSRAQLYHKVGYHSNECSGKPGLAVPSLVSLVRVVA